MGYESFVKEAAEQYRSLGEERGELYKRHYIGMETSVREALGQEQPVGNGADRLTDSVSAKVMGFDAVFNNGLALRNSSGLVKLAKLKEMDEKFFRAALYRSGDDKYVAFIHSRSDSAICVDVPDGQSKKLSLMFLNSAPVVPLQMRITLGEKSSLNLSELFVSSSGVQRSVVAPLHEVTAGKGSRAEFNIIHNQNAGTDVMHFCKAKIGEEGRARFNIIYNGGRIMRARNEMVAAGHSALVEVNEAIMSSGDQRFDLYTGVSNAAPMSVCHSETKAILAGKSSGYVKGFAKILEGAFDARSYVKERGLLLDRGCHVDLIPDMSIEQNNVKATHSGGSAPIDQNALFYLMSRGTDIANARRLIINGFLSELLSRIENFEVRRAAFALIHDKVLRGVFGQIPDVSTVDMWTSEHSKEQSIFEGHYKYR